MPTCVLCGTFCDPRAGDEAMRAEHMAECDAMEELRRWKARAVAAESVLRAWGQENDENSRRTLITPECGLRYEAARAFADRLAAEASTDA